MTNEDIKKLSEAYAEYMCPVGDYCGGVYDDQRNTDLPIYKDDAKSVLEWLSERYCIVPKEQIYMRHGVANALMGQDPAHKEFYRGQSSVLESIFGKDLFNEMKK